MAKITIMFGVLLILLGSFCAAYTGWAYPTALIPVWFGIVLCLCGVLANTENAKRRMLWMHVAVTMGLIGFIGAIGRAIMVYVRSNGAPMAHPIAVYEQIAMGAICLFFVMLCVRSFIAARKARVASA
jgi:hypothetical protein